MQYTIYTQESPALRVYQASAGDLNAAIKACDILAPVTRYPLVMVPANPRSPTIRYQVKQMPLPFATPHRSKSPCPTIR